MALPQTSSSFGHTSIPVMIIVAQGNESSNRSIKCVVLVSISVYESLCVCGGGGV